MKDFKTINRIFFIAVSTLLWGCSGNSAVSDNVEGKDHSHSHDSWSYNLSMYEVNLRAYTPEGTFIAFEQHLDRLADLGVGIIWFMPLHPVGEVERKGTLGSFYSIKNYREVNPEFGSKQDFARLVRRAQDRGMRVIVDWVPNHTALDNYLTEVHPEWYVREKGEFIVPPGTDWTDVIQLNHANDGLVNYLIEAKKYWLDEFGIDGFRFDAVSFLPMDFWEEVIAALRDKKPDILLLAEGSGPEWLEVGFDISHAWWYYGFGDGLLIDLVEQKINADRFYELMEENLSHYSDSGYQLFFTSNHDENAWHGTPKELFGAAEEAFAVLSSTYSGMPLIYNGQEAGLNERIDFFEKQEIDWSSHPHGNLYSNLFHLKKRNSALWNGLKSNSAIRIETSSDSQILAYIRKNEEHSVLVVLNLSDAEAEFTFDSSDLKPGSWREIFTGKDRKFMSEDQYSLPAWGYRVYENIN